MKNKIIKLFVFLFVLLSQFEAFASSNSNFKDWRKSCEPNKNNNQQSCHIFQNLSTKNEGKLILHVAVGKFASQNEVKIVFTLPLGVALVPGIVVQIDKGQKYKQKYNVCSPKGCLVVTKLTSDMLQQLKAGMVAKVSFANAVGKVFTVSVSLSGFTAGFKSLSQS